MLYIESITNNYELTVVQLFMYNRIPTTSQTSHITDRRMLECVCVCVMKRGCACVLTMKIMK